MRRLPAVLACLACLVFGGGVAFAGDTVTLVYLVENAAALDGQTVTIQGEVVGDVMMRGDFGWINVGDATGDVGVWAPAESLRKVQYAGRYHAKGDIVRVTGVFHRADPEHGGDLDIHAGQVEVVEAGGPVSRPRGQERLPWALASLTGALALGVVVWRRKGGLV